MKLYEASHAAHSPTGPLLLLEVDHGTPQPADVVIETCGEHDFVLDIELIRIPEIDTFYERMLNSDAKYRLVMDMASLRNETAA